MVARGGDYVLHFGLAAELESDARVAQEMRVALHGEASVFVGLKGDEGVAALASDDVHAAVGDH